MNTSDNEYKKHDGIPNEGSLTFKNGFYVDVTVVSVDMRGSKKLAEKHTPPVLAKIYRSYISEVIAVMNGNSTITDIFIEGDGVWAVFNTITDEHVQSVFSTTSKISSLINALNKKLLKRKYSEIKVGIGIEVVWIGKIVGESAKLSGYGNRELYDKQTMVSGRIYKMLNENQQSLLKWNANRRCYHGNSIWKSYE